MGWPYVGNFRFHLIAEVGYEVWASRMEGTPFENHVGIGHHPLDGLQSRFHVRADAGNGFQQRAGIGMLRIIEDGIHIGMFYHLAQIHDHDLF